MPHLESKTKKGIDDNVDNLRLGDLLTTIETTLRPNQLSGALRGYSGPSGAS